MKHGTLFAVVYHLKRSFADPYRRAARYKTTNDMTKQILTLALVLGAAAASAFSPAGPQPKTKALPTVFLLGEYEANYDELVQTYPLSMLEACACSKEDAFSKWIGMLNELDIYARKQNVDIRGVKLWLHVFYNADGSVKHIAYHLRPNSRQLDAEVIVPLLEGFARQYRFPITGDQGYAHYSTGAFPVFGDLTGGSNR